MVRSTEVVKMVKDNGGWLAGAAVAGLGLWWLDKSSPKEQRVVKDSLSEDGEIKAAKFAMKNVNWKTLAAGIGLVTLVGIEVGNKLYPRYQVKDTEVIDVEVIDPEVVEEEMKRAQAEGEWMCGPED